MDADHVALVTGNFCRVLVAISEAGNSPKVRQHEEQIHAKEMPFPGHNVPHLELPILGQLNLLQKWPDEHFEVFVARTWNYPYQNNEIPGEPEVRVEEMAHHKYWDHGVLRILAQQDSIAPHRPCQLIFSDLGVAENPFPVPARKHVGELRAGVRSMR